LKCLIGAVKHSIHETNFQVIQGTLALFQEAIKINGEGQLTTKAGELQNDLDAIGTEIIKKLTDNNPKIKTATEQAFALMVNSNLFGVEHCCGLLCRSKVKLSGKQLTARLV